MIHYNKAMMNQPKHIYTEHKTSSEHIHHTNDMTSISAIGTNHAKILTGLKDSRLHNKLAESKAKKWINMGQVLQDIADMAVNFERSLRLISTNF